MHIINPHRCHANHMLTLKFMAGVWTPVVQVYTVMAFAHRFVCTCNAMRYEMDRVMHTYVCDNLYLKIALTILCSDS